jgi:hypothetical protein
MLTSKEGHAEVVKLLLILGADVNTQDQVSFCMVGINVPQVFGSRNVPFACCTCSGSN